MRRYFCLILIPFLFACSTKYQAPDNKDIDAIVEAVILQGHLWVLKNTGEGRGEPYSFCKELRKLKVVVKDSVGRSSSSNFNIVQVNNLTGTQYFVKEDEDFFLYQNKILPRFVISRQVQSRLNITTFEEQRGLHASDKFYEASIPIFSEDLNKAYVEITFNCPGFCKGVTAFFLKRIDGKWFVVGSKIIQPHANTF